MAAWRGVALESVMIAAAEDGAPEALIEIRRRHLALSLSHRARAGAGDRGGRDHGLGCDLEAIEPRSDAFLREWLRPAERELVSAQNGEARDLAANLIWTAKEAASKARREGLRLNLRRATVEAEGLAQPARSWARLEISWEGGPIELGWWRQDAGWVMTVTSDPASEAAPNELS